MRVQIPQCLGPLSDLSPIKSSMTLIKTALVLTGYAYGYILYGVHRFITIGKITCCINQGHRNDLKRGKG